MTDKAMKLLRELKIDLHEQYDDRYWVQRIEEFLAAPEAAPEKETIAQSLRRRGFAEIPASAATDSGGMPDMREHYETVSALIRMLPPENQECAAVDFTIASAAKLLKDWHAYALALREKQEGYVLVPREPTIVMQDAMHKADDDYSNNRFHGNGHLSRGEFIYKAMLTASEKRNEIKRSVRACGVRLEGDDE